MEKVLLIAGGGTLGTYVTEETVDNGVHVDVICLEEYKSNEMVTYYKEKVTFDYIKEFLNGKKYNAIVDFLHYIELEDFKNVYNLYSEHAEQIMYLSSYRVYADSEHPIKETSPGKCTSRLLLNRPVSIPCPWEFISSAKTHCRRDR